MQHVVITGGTGGLGAVVASVLRNRGWDVEAPGSKDLDVRDRKAIDRFFRGRAVDLLVCAAGITGDALLARQTPEQWDEVLDVNLRGARRCAIAALEQMIPRKQGHIIFVSSHSAVHPPVGQAAYAASKAALLGLTRDLASLHGQDGIRVNAILPGFLETRMTAGLGETRRQEILADHHLGRFNTPEAVGALIRCLHEDLTHTSGQIFQLDSRFCGPF